MVFSRFTSAFFLLSLIVCQAVDVADFGMFGNKKLLMSIGTNPEGNTIVGDSPNSEYLGWLELNSIDWSISPPLYVNRKVEFGGLDFGISANLDSSSMEVANIQAVGATQPVVTVEMVSIENEMSLVLVRYTLYDVTISNFANSFKEDIPTVQYTLHAAAANVVSFLYERSNPSELIQTKERNFGKPAGIRRLRGADN